MSNRLTKLIYLLISVFTAGTALAAVKTILFARDQKPKKTIGLDPKMDSLKV